MKQVQTASVIDDRETRLARAYLREDVREEAEALAGLRS